MFGAFRPSAPLSGGLLWKIPYRLSRFPKLRHRKRLRKVDNIVAVLDTALKRQAASLTHQPSLHTTDTTSTQSTINDSTQPSALSNPSDPQLNPRSADQESRRHGRGPLQGEMVPTVGAYGVRTTTSQLLTDTAARQGTMKILERWKAEMPTEAEMLPRDKYSVFSRYSKGYRKGVHKIPKWTRVSQRLNPPGF